MEIASIIVVAVLFWSLWFFISLPFFNEHETADQKSFGGIKQAFIGRKVVFALMMSVLSTVSFYLIVTSGLFDGLYEGGL